MNWNCYLNSKTTVWLLLVIMGMSTNSHAQTTWTGMGSDSNWSNVNNWDTGVSPTGTTEDVIVGAPSPTTLNINVDLNSLFVDVDGILNFNSSRNLDFGGTGTTTLMNMGTINVANNSDLQFAGTVLNTGMINVQNGGNITSIEIDSVAELSGGGTIFLSGTPGNSRFDGVNDAVLTIVDQTIEGHGNVGANTASIVNQANGLIDANQLNGLMNVDPNTNGFVNDGTLQASAGGILRIDGFGGGSFDNTNGTVQALMGSEVRIEANAMVAGGVIRSEGGGIVNVPASQNVFLSDLTLDADIMINNNSDLGITGNIVNSGTITAISGGNQTGPEVQADGATLTGGGTIVLTNNNNARIDGIDNPVLTIVDQTIEGRGNIGGNTMSIINQTDGLIDANQAGLQLNVDPDANGFTNDGTLQASDGGELRIDGFGGGAFENTNGVIQALTGSQVRLDANATINGGTVRSEGDGSVVVPTSQNVFLSDLTLDADIVINNNSDFGITGNIVNNGTITAVSGGNQTGLEVQADGATLTGGGTIVITNNNNARIDGVSNPVLTIVDQTIEGRGNIGGSTMSIVNQADGLIDANQSGLQLNVDPDANGFTNDGTLQASDGGELRIDGFGGGSFENTNGVIQALAGSQVRLDATATINGGIIRSEGDGSVFVPTSQNVFLSDLTLDADIVINNNSDFGITGNIVNNGTITAISGGNQTGLEIQAAGATISGTGNIVLTGNSNALIDGFAPVTISGGRLSGIGRVNVESTFDDAAVAAGSSVGTLTFNNVTNFLNGTCIEFEASSANATPGTTSDQIVINGDLNLQSPMLASGLEIKMITLDENGDPNPLPDFDPSQNYSFVIAVADQINGYAPGNVTVDTSGFQNSFTGTFSATIGPNGSDQAIFVKYGQFQLGDINQDGAINLLDVAPFVDLLSTGGTSFEGDINCDGALNLLDVEPFVAILSN